MLALQSCELLPKSQLLKQEAPARLEEAKNPGQQESDGVYHVWVL
jgi:hypothetical protein